MSKAVSALNGASYKGFVQVEELGLRGMITLRGDLSSAKLKAAATAVAGIDMPGQRKCNVIGEKGIAWMSPDEVLVMVPYAETDAAIAAIDKTLKGEHYLAEAVSDARAVFRLTGTDAQVREVMGKVAPVDFSPSVFGVGDFRRSRLAQVAGAFWMPAEGQFELVCFRSVAQYVFDLLKASAEPGSAVGLY